MVPARTSHHNPPFKATVNTCSFAIKPTVGGNPVSDINATARQIAIAGDLLPIPAKSSIKSLPVLLDIAMTATNAARFVAA